MRLDRLDNRPALPVPLSLCQRKFHLEPCVTIAGAGRAPFDRLWHAIPYSHDQRGLATHHRLVVRRGSLMSPVVSAGL